jgi:hypothetical protein
MARLLVAVLLGIVLAVGGSVLAAKVLAGSANGTFTNASLYQYGNR